MHKHRLGIDLGGTSAKIALIDHRDRVVREGSVSTRGFPKPVDLTERLAKVCKDLMVGGKVDQLGVGVAGDIDSSGGVVRVSPNLGWKNVPLGKMMKRKLKCRVLVENDAKAAAWGLYRTQIPKSIRHLIVMTLGTGVGGGLILNGHLHRGATGTAGEVGHMNIEEKGPLCNCGLRGCLETYVGGPHLVRRIKMFLRMGKRSSLQKIYKENPDKINPKLIADSAKKGDPLSISVWERAGHALGLAVGDLVYLLNPQMIVFTGGISQAGSLLLNPLWNTLQKRTFHTPIKAVKIKIASQTTHWGVIGASLL